ncbi:hypothetical protein ACF0H5_015822 [Mactra antiquata]
MVVTDISVNGNNVLKTSQPGLFNHMIMDNNQLSEYIVSERESWADRNASNVALMNQDLTKDKRTMVYNNHLQWKCFSQMNWRDLGNDVYPRFVQDYVCTQIPCVRGYYQCQSVFYPVRVFTRRNITEQTVDAHVPNEIQDTWKSIVVDVSVGCECKRPSGLYSP